MTPIETSSYYQEAGFFDLQGSEMPRFNGQLLHFMLGKTEYGRTLNDSIRFGRFKPDFVKTEQWEFLLGADVNNYKHMEYMAGLTDWYTDNTDELSGAEQHRLSTTAWTHDFAEAIDGDTPDPEKDHSRNAKLQEIGSFVIVASSVTEYPIDLAAYVMPVAQQIVPLGDQWRAIELIGYHQTGVRAYKAVQLLRMLNLQTRKKEILLRSLSGMAEVVTESSLAALNSYNYPPVNKYLERGLDG